MALKDVSTAFLQSLKYPDGMVKYLSMKHPITGEILYFKQNGPIYGEASAPVRWENTIAPWLEEQGFERGKNEKPAFYNKERGLLLLLCVDDCLVDGQEEGINWIFELLDNRFDCKELRRMAQRRKSSRLPWNGDVHERRLHLPLHVEVNY